MSYTNITKYLAIAALAATSLTASALPTDFYKSSTPLAQGNWVRVKVSNSGMQQIPVDSLRAWGFDHPELVTVFGHGGVVGFDDRIDANTPDGLVQQPVVYTDDKIVFYGEADSRLSFAYWAPETKFIKNVPVIERNLAATAGYYFITDGMPLYSEQSIPYSFSTYTKDSHKSLLGYEDEYENSFRGGQMTFGPNIFDLEGRQTTATFKLYDRNLTEYGSNVVMRPIVIAVNEPSKTYAQVSMTCSYGDDEATFDFDLPKINDEQQAFTHSTKERSTYVDVPLAAGRDEFTFAITPGSDASKTCSYIALDNFAMWYPRDNRLGDHSELLMVYDDISANINVLLRDVNPDDTHVWRVVDGYDVRPYQTDYNTRTGIMRFTCEKNYKVSSSVNSRPLRAIAFNASSEHNSVEFAGRVTNHINIHGLENPDLIIISSDVCYNEAMGLAEIHRQQLGHVVHVFRQQDIFDEFSSGTPSLWGIRRMIKMFYDRDNSKIKSVLLFGGSYFDNRGVTSTGKAYLDNGQSLLCYGTTDYATMKFKTKNYVTDSYFGKLSDNTNALFSIYSDMQVSVGRLPAMTDLEAKTAVDKIESYLENIPTADVLHRILVISDSGDKNSHQQNAESVAEKLHNIPDKIDPATGKVLSYYNGMTTVKAYNSIYTYNGTDALYLRQALTQALNQGVSLVTYTGHGRADRLGKASNIWSINNINETNYSFYPIGMFATCDTYEFDRTTLSMANSLIFKNNGGLIGLIAASRTVYQSANQLLLNRATDAYCQLKPSDLAGDIYRQAHNALIVSTNETTRNNTLCYNYAGDPALPLYVADKDIKVTSINGRDYSADEAFTITPLNENTLSGYVAATDGNADNSYNGTVILTLYETGITRVTFDDENGRKTNSTYSVAIDMDEDVISEVAAEVVNGRFTVNFTPPLPSREATDDMTNRLTLMTFNHQRQFAKGYITNTVVDLTDIPEEIADTEAPVIEQLYIDDPSFRSGDNTGGQFTIYAKIAADASGLRKSNGNVGGSARMVIDGSRSVPVSGTAMRSNADGTTDIVASVTTISDGRHDLTLSVSDNVGNTSSRTIEFVVINTPAQATLAVAEKPARHEATFTVAHTFNHNPIGRLVIEDADGNTIFSRADVDFSQPFVWDLTDSDDINNKNLVPDGIYQAHAILYSELQYATTPKVDVIVIQE